MWVYHYSPTDIKCMSVSKFNNLGEMKKLLEKNNLPRVTQDEV